MGFAAIFMNPFGVDIELWNFQNSSYYIMNIELGIIETVMAKLLSVILRVRQCFGGVRTADLERMIKMDRSSMTTAF